MSEGDSKCPCNIEKANKFFDDHAQAVENIQAMLFWKRPIPMILLIVFIVLIALFIGKYDLGFLEVATLFTTLYIALKIIVPAYSDILVSYLFPQLQNKGTAEELNRIYSLDEIKHGYSVFYKHVGYLMKKDKKEQKKKNLFVSLGISSCAMIVFYFIGTFAPIIIIIHLVILLPGILLHPKVSKHVVPLYHKVVDYFHKKAKVA